MNLGKITKRFLMGEAFAKTPSLRALIQSLEETMNNLSPRSQSDARKLEVARSHIREVRKQVRRLQEQNEVLQEELNVLKEGQDE